MRHDSGGTTCPRCQSPQSQPFGACARCGAWRDPVVLAPRRPLTDETRAALATFLRELRGRLHDA